MKLDPGRDSADVSPRVPLRVLIVEDSLDDALLLLRELERGGYEPDHERVDTPEAMRRALAERGPWDVVLSDWQMPRFEAPEALEIFRATGSEAPFVIVSGKVGEEAAVEAMRAGAYDYVMKGNLARLCATVERGLQEAQARRERRRAEEERDRLFEFSPDLLGVAGLDGRFKRVNPAFEETLGYSSEELLAKPFIEFVHPEDRAATMSELESLGRGVQTAYFENRYLHKDGSEVWLEWKAVPVVEEDVIYATARDVTERKRAEEALRRRDAILRAVAFAAERFLKQATPWQESAQEVLERLGMAAEVSRVYIFENYAGVDGAKLPTKRYEWLAPGIPAGADNPTAIALPNQVANYSRWGEILCRGELLCGHRREFPQEEQPMLEAEGVLSIALVSIFVEGEWWGFIGFDECTSEREWSAAETEALEAAAGTLGAAIQRERAEEALRRRDAILGAVAFAAERFLERVASWEESAPEVLERLGQAAEVSRVRIHENHLGEDGEVRVTLRYEWVAPGVSAQIDNPRMEAFRYQAAGYGRWMETLSRGELIYGHAREFPESEQPALEAQDILSIAVVPIFVEGEWWGQIGFDECTSEREWSAAEIDALKAATDTLGAAIQRERAEVAIRQSEQLYRTVVEQATEYISLVDIETRRFVGSNRAFREALGYTEEELKHMTLYDIVAHDQESIDENARRVVERGRYSLGERKHRRKDGTLVDVEVSASTVLHDGREVACIVGHDITERKRAEEEIKQERDFSSAITDTVGALVGVFDSEGRIVRFNRACERLSGYTFEEVRGRYFWELFLLPEEVESVKDVAREITAGQFPNSNENYWVVRDGSLRLISWHNSALLDERGEVAYIIATGIDITEQRRAEDELRESQRALATLMSNLPGMAYRCRNDPDWTMELVSEGCLDLTGFPPADLIGNRRRSYGDLIHPDDRDEVWESVQAALASPEHPTFQFNYRITTASGAEKWVWEQGRGVFSPEGTLLALEGFIADITERKLARDALEQSEERYRAVVEQAAEGIFLFDAATGDILESNTAFRELLGYTTGELLSMKVYDFVADDRESIDRNILLTLNEGRRYVGERRYRRRDGSLVDIEATGSMIYYRGREVICTVIRDVTERVEAFRMLEERVTALAGISASLTVGQPVEAILDALAAGVTQSTAAVACAVVLIDEETGLLRTAGSHGLPEGYAAGLEAAYRAGVRSRTRTLEVFRTRRPMLFRDARRSSLNNPLFFPIHSFLREAPWDTIYFVPLVSRGRAVGVLNLYYLPGHEPGEDETVFLKAAADQTAVAVENARLFSEAQGKAALEERQRLARELHDSVSQALYGIALGSRTARTLLDREGPPERVDEWLEYVLSLAEAGLTEMRALIFELRPESLQTEGLIAALNQQAAALEARHEIPVYTTLGEEPDELNLETKEALYRITQEALHNIVKHARANKAEVKLEREAEGGIALEVSDDGAGFDPGEDFSGHLGLKSMGERAARLGGTLQVESAPGEGTSIRVRIPPGT